MKPASDVHFYRVGDEGGLLLCEGGQTIHALDRSAALIWSGLQQGLPRPALLSGLATELACAASDAAAAFDAVARNWHGLGLLDGSEAQRSPVARPNAAASPAPEPSAVQGRPVASRGARAYRLLESCFRLRFTSAAAAERTDQVLGHLAVRPESPSNEFLDIIEAEDSGITVRCAGDVVARRRSAEEIGPLLKSLLWAMAVNRFDFFLDIHAGVVGYGAACLLLPAPSGSGKSCLTAALSSSGFAYLSDEVALLDDCLRATTIPLSICVKSTAWDLIRNYRPELDHLPAHRRGDGKVVKYLRPINPLPVAEMAWPVRWMIFPHFDPERPSTLTKIGKLDALGRLLAQCVALPRRLTPARVEGLADWIGGVDCWTLGMSSLGEAIDLVRGALGVARRAIGLPGAHPAGSA